MNQVLQQSETLRTKTGSTQCGPCRMYVYVLIVSLLGVGSLAGCAGRNVNVYRPHTLPVEYMASPVSNPHVVDLSALAIPVTGNQVVERGDVIDVSIASGYEEGKVMSRQIRIADDGTAMIPLIGNVRISSMTLPHAELAIKQASIQSGVYINPTVTVSINQYRLNRITVVGAVNRPGIVELRRGNSGLLQALVAAGGLSKSAGPEVEVRRPGRASAVQLSQQSTDSGEVVPVSFNTPVPTNDVADSVRVNLIQASEQGTGAIALDDGDVVMVEKIDPQPIQVLGLVKRPGQYDLPVNQELRVLDALALAGGWSSPVADHVNVIRKIPGREEPIVIKISIREAKLQGQGNQRLMAGDIVSVEHTAATSVLSAAQRFIRVSIGGSARFF